MLHRRNRDAPRAAEAEQGDDRPVATDPPRAAVPVPARGASSSDLPDGPPVRDPGSGDGYWRDPAGTVQIPIELAVMAPAMFDHLRQVARLVGPDGRVGCGLQDLERVMEEVRRFVVSLRSIDGARRVEDAVRIGNGSVRRSAIRRLIECEMVVSRQVLSRGDRAVLQGAAIDPDQVAIDMPDDLAAKLSPTVRDLIRIGAKMGLSRIRFDVDGPPIPFSE